MSEPSKRTEDLDPEDWPSYRAEAHRLLDLALDHIQSARERPVWRSVPDSVKRALAEPVPWQGGELAQLGSEVADHVMPYATGNTHPRFFGWVHGTGTAGGLVAEMLAAAMNANLGGRDHAPIYVERQVVEWCRQVFGLPESAGGLLVTGTSMGTLLSLAIARRQMATETVEGGMAAGGDLVIYTSNEAHNSVAKGAMALGFARGRVRSIPVDATGGMQASILRRSIAEDRRNGLRPFCIVGTAGTVNCGSFDDLNELADIAEQEGLWLHVDGAFGGLVILSERHHHLVEGIDRAHSLAFDFHKWVHVPYSVGCVLVRDKSWQLETFSDRPDYLAAQEGGLAGGNPWFCEMGLELSRGFLALKVWFTLKEQGLAKIGRMIAKNCDQARHLMEQVDLTADLQLLTPAFSNICCFRFYPKGLPRLDIDKLDDVNKRIVIGLQEKGIAAPSTTRIDGKLAIRVNITNHRTEIADIDHLLEAVVYEGKRIWKT